MMGLKFDEDGPSVLRNTKGTTSRQVLLVAEREYAQFEPAQVVVYWNNVRRCVWNKLRWAQYLMVRAIDTFKRLMPSD